MNRVNACRFCTEPLLFFYVHENSDIEIFMRKLALILCMFLTFMPGMTLAACLHDEGVPANEPVHVHQHDSKAHNHSPAHPEQHCSQGDLQYVTGGVALKEPTLSGKIFYVTVFDEGHSHGFQLARAQTIRGPPPDWPGVKQASASILITTARLRI
jgi:hypothetical protein